MQRKKHHTQPEGKLAKANKEKLGYSIPSSYFEDFQSKQLSILEENTKPAKRLRFRSLAWGAVAVVIVFCSLAMLYWPLTSDPSQPVAEATKELELQPTQEWLLTTLLEEKEAVEDQIEEQLIEQWVIEEVKQEVNTEEALLETILEENLEKEELEDEVLDQLIL